MSNKCVSISTMLKRCQQINLNKSQALYLYAPPEADLSSPFRLAPSGFQYLEINVTPDLYDFFKANYTPLITKISQDLSNWSNLPISFLFILFKFILFKLNSNKSKFIWSKKKPRLKFSTVL